MNSPGIMSVIVAKHFVKAYVAPPTIDAVDAQIIFP